MRKMILPLALLMTMIGACRTSIHTSDSRTLGANANDVATKDVRTVTEAKADFAAKYAIGAATGISKIDVENSPSGAPWLSVEFKAEADRKKFEGTMTRRRSEFKKLGDQWLYIYMADGFPSQIGQFILLKLRSVNSGIVLSDEFIEKSRSISLSAKDDLISKYPAKSIKGLDSISVEGSVTNAWISVKFKTDAARRKFEDTMQSNPESFMQNNGKWLYIYKTPGFPGQITFFVRLRIDVAA